jgi:hypothetical protein
MKTSTKGLLLMIGGFIGNLAVGSILAWGILESYIASYLRHYDSTVTINSMIILFPISMMGEMIGVAGGVRATAKFGPRISYAIGGAFMSGGILACVFV